MFDLDSLTQAAYELEPLPASTSRLASIAISPSVDLAEIVDLIALDQGLTVSILRAANSATVGGSRKVSLVRDAVQRVGGGTIVNLAVGRRVRALMAGAMPAYHLSEGELWRHSVSAALAAERCAKVCRVRVPPESFTAALLHDVGKLVLVRFLSPDVVSALERAHEEAGASSLESEREILGVHHGELAELVAQRWELPEAITKPLAVHHAPGEEDGPVADVVHLADVVARRIGNGADDDPAELEPGVAARLGIGAEAIEALAVEVAASFDEVERRYAG